MAKTTLVQPYQDNPSHDEPNQASRAFQEKPNQDKPSLAKNYQA